MSNVSLEEGIILHKKRYKRSYILTLWLKNLGRVNALATPNIEDPFVYQIFSIMYLYIDIKKNYELIRVKSVEKSEYLCARSSHSLHLAKLEINSILVRLLPFGHVCDYLFSLYLDLIENMQIHNQAFYLARFKLILLESLGYGLQTEIDQAQHPIQASAMYKIGILSSFTLATTQHVDNKEYIPGAIIQKLTEPEEWNLETLHWVQQIVDINIQKLMHHEM